MHSRLLILVARQSPTETFLGRDVDRLGSGFGATEVIEAQPFIDAHSAVRRIFAAGMRDAVAERIITKHRVTAGDTILSYWSNYILDISARIAVETQGS